MVLLNNTKCRNLVQDTVLNETQSNESGDYIDMNTMRLGRVALMMAAGVTLTLDAMGQKFPTWEPARAEAMIRIEYTPTDWTRGHANGSARRRMQTAVEDLAKSRVALAELWQRRAMADAAKTSLNPDVLLDIHEGFVSYDNNVVRPMHNTAPQWSDLDGQSLDRVRNMMQEYEPGREDMLVRFTCHGGVWQMPQVGMLNTKTLQGTHFLGCRDARFQWTDTSFTGQFGLITMRGDRRFQMHFSGETSNVSVPEFRHNRHNVCGVFWPDWWVGPRERQQPWTQLFAINAGKRVGWILSATLRNDKLADGSPALGLLTGDCEIYAWIENARMQRGYAILPGKLRGRGP